MAHPAPVPRARDPVSRFLSVLNGLERGDHRAGRVALERRLVPRTGDTVLVVRRGVPAFERYPIRNRGRPGVWLVGVVRVLATALPVLCAAC